MIRHAFEGGAGTGKTMSGRKASRDTQWIRDAFDRYEGPLVRYAMRITGDLDALGAPQGRAEDLALKVRYDPTHRWTSVQFLSSGDLAAAGKRIAHSRSLPASPGSS